MMKIGRFLYVLNQLVVSPEFKVGSVAELDARLALSIPLRQRREIESERDRRLAELWGDE